MSEELANTPVCAKWGDRSGRCAWSSCDIASHYWQYIFDLRRMNVGQNSLWGVPLRLPDSQIITAEWSPRLCVDSVEPRPS